MDPVSLSMAAASALGKNAYQRTQEYNAARKAEDIQDQAATQTGEYIDKLKKEYAPYLKGELTPGELKARETTVGLATEENTANTEESLRRYQQNLVRAGVTGGDATSSVAGRGMTSIEKDAAKILQDYVSKIDADLNATAGARQERAMGTIANAEQNAANALMPLEQQTEIAKDALRSSEINLPSPGNPTAGLGGNSMGNLLNMFAPTAITAGVGAATGQDVSGMVRNQAVNQVLQPFGLNAGMFAQPEQELPKEVGGKLYKKVTTRDALGNPITKWVESGSATKVLDTQTPSASNSLDTAYLNKVAAINADPLIADKEQAIQALTEIYMGIKQKTTTTAKPQTSLVEVTLKKSVAGYKKGAKVKITQDALDKHPEYYQK